MQIKSELLVVLLLTSATVTPLMASAQQAYLTDGTSTVIATSSQADLHAYMNKEASLSGESNAPAVATTSPKGFFARFFNWLGGLF
jgi:hypothetical protein